MLAEAAVVIAVVLGVLSIGERVGGVAVE